MLLSELEDHRLGEELVPPGTDEGVVVHLAHDLVLGLDREESIEELLLGEGLLSHGPTHEVELEGSGTVGVGNGEAHDLEVLQLVERHIKLL